MYHGGCFRVFRRLSREALVFGEMYPVADKTFPYGLRENMLQTLLGATVGELLQATIGHQEAHVVLTKGWTLRAYGKISHSSNDRPKA